MMGNILFTHRMIIRIRMLNFVRETRGSEERRFESCSLHTLRSDGRAGLRRHVQECFLQTFTAFLSKQ
jgi:hypothetical protein